MLRMKKELSKLNVSNLSLPIEISALKLLTEFTNQTSLKHISFY